jgi:2-polyprenyl-6-hydroxyphenyl methylase / 3-demethylubiquinone-9 3-methyltransferase
MAKPLPTSRRPLPGTAAPDEVARFSALAEEWWDADGKFRPLHRINPLRIAFIRDRMASHFGRDPLGADPLGGLEVLDIGCGGGLLSEPMRRLGARVMGIDAGQEAVRVAALHAEQGGLDIEYRSVLPEALAADRRTFDAVLNMEVIEHVADVGAFLTACCAMVKPGGIMVLATLNRTLKSFALAKIGAEYVLRWLPAGTHDWRKFVKPSELAAGLRPHGLRVVDLKGLAYRPLADEWSLSDDVDVNYIAVAVKR